MIGPKIRSDFFAASDKVSFDTIRSRVDGSSSYVADIGAAEPKPGLSADVGTAPVYDPLKLG